MTTRRESIAARLLGALPWLGLCLGVLIFYWVEASLRRSPWVFTDELEWAQLSRAIASTGHEARRGQPIGFTSLYAYLIAPAWWIHSTATAYAAIKYLNSFVMCLAAVPTYLMARLLVSRRVAVVVALLSIAIPAMSYATSIVPESLAYAWFALAAWLAVRALAASGWSAALLAAAAAAVGPFIREEFLMLPVSLVLAGTAAWVIRGGGAARRIPWQRTLLAVVGVAVLGYLFNRFAIERVQTWSASRYLNRHTLREGSLAVGALAIGLGVLPVIGGIASLYLPERRREPAYRAFVLYLGASLVTLVGYTAAKSAFLTGSSGSLIEERNVFFLSPLLLLGTALVLGAAKIDWRLVGAATVLVMVTVWSSLFEVGAPYYEAPGLANLTIVNRDFRWDVNDFHRLLGAAALVSIALLAFRRRRGVPVLAAVLTCAWLLTGEIYATSANTHYANKFVKTLPAPRSWVDAATHGAHVTFLGQEIDPNPSLLWLTEFWNRSLQHVASLDGTAPGPGPTFVPGLQTPDGVLNESTGDRYTLAGPGVSLAAPVVERRDGYTLYRTLRPWQLLDEEQNVYADGWATSPIGYTYFPKGGPGWLTINLSRTGYTGPGKPGLVTIRVGTVRVVDNGGPELGRVLDVRHTVIRNGEEKTVRIHVASTPVTVSVTVVPTFSTPTDSRPLAAQVAFGFAPDAGSSAR